MMNQKLQRIHESFGGIVTAINDYHRTHKVLGEILSKLNHSDPGHIQIGEDILKLVKNSVDLVNAIHNMAETIKTEYEYEALTKSLLSNTEGEKTC